MLADITYFEKCTDENITDIINLLQKKFKTSSKWSIEQVDVRNIIPLCKHVYNDRLEYAQKSILKCIQYGVPLFYPYVAHYNNGDTHLVLPPIVEERNQKLYLGDGMHRMYCMRELDISTAYVLITRECMLPLPGKPQIWSSVKKNPIQLPVHMNFEGFVRTGLTGYSKFCNSNIFWKKLEEKK